MSKFPFLPVDVDAYFGATRELTTIQHGAYLLLLMEAWRRPTCTLPDNDEKLARLAGLDLMEWHGMKSDVMSFWDYDGRSKGWTQKRLKKERNYVADVRAKKRDAAVSSWKTRKKTNANAVASAKHFTPSLSLKDKSLKDDDFFFEPDRWFSTKEIELRKHLHPHYDVEKKLSEYSFRKWAFEATPNDPLVAARNWLDKNARVVDADAKLQEIKNNPKPIKASGALLESRLMKGR